MISDTEGARCDSLCIEMENASTWYSWTPEKDDRILVIQDGYDSGTMYLNTIEGEDGHFSLFATSLPCSAREKRNRSYAGKTLNEIIQSAAMESGMDYALFGIDGQTVIPYIQQYNESCAAFLARLLRLEGATLKCINGKYAAIGLAWAQARAAHQTLTILPGRRGTTHRKDGNRAKTLKVRSACASGTATDEDADGTLDRLREDIPATDNAQAGRWARGLLLDENRQCESICIESAFNPGLTAATRIDLRGNPATAGQWIITEAGHDLINMQSTAKLLRCILSIA